jgi:hypothetical protein
MSKVFRRGDRCRERREDERDDGEKMRKLSRRGEEENT